MNYNDFPTCDSCDHWDKPKNLEHAGVGLCKSEDTMWSVWEYGMKNRKSENLITLGCYGCNNHSDIIEEE